MPNRHPKWFSVYAIGSSSLILILLGVLVFRHPDSSRESVADEKQRTAEIEKQGKAQRELLEQQRLAAEQQSQRQAAEAKAQRDLLEQQRIAAEQQAQRRAAEAKRASALARIQGLEGQLAVLRQSLATTVAEKDDYTTKVKDYAMDHKAADQSDRFTDDQKKVAGVGAVVAGLYALSNHEECAEVANQMAKAVTIQSDYDQRINTARQQISSLQSQIDEEKKQLE
jgi:colicin import membrane protein